MRILFLCTLGFVMACCSSQENESTTNPEPDTSDINSIALIDEFIIPNQDIGGVPIGGFSGIDYKDDKYYIISDASSAPVRFYQATARYTDQGFNTITIDSSIEIKNENGLSFENNQVDPESIRFNSSTGSFLYTSEGSIANGVSPSLIEISEEGMYIKSFLLPEHLAVDPNSNDFGPRHNGALEGLSLSFDHSGYWIAMELPLIQDGPEPELVDTKSPVRFTFISTSPGMASKQFAYELDPVTRPPALDTDFIVNGVVEILEYEDLKFLVLERSFSSGYLDGGNTVKLYKVDASSATNTIGIENLSSASYTPATKTLLFNFDTIRSSLTNNTVDNLEGMTFGPNFNDGKRALIIVSDNNFSSFFPQYNQFLLLKINP